MFHGIEMQVVDVRREIPFISDQMLPVSALPHAAFPTRNAHGQTPLGGRQPFGESPFDQPQPQPQLIRRNALRLLRPTPAI